MSYIVLCQILGPVFVIATLSMGMHLKKREKFLHDLDTNHGFSFMGNVMRCMIGLTIYTLVELSLSPIDIALKTAGGVIAIIGAICMIFPTVEKDIIKKTVHKIPLFIVMLIVQGLIGIAMLYVGYGA